MRRSYSRGKDYEVILDEFREGSGSRYAPFIVELFNDLLVEKDIRALLADGRKENYRNTYHLIKEMHKGEGN